MGTRKNCTKCEKEFTTVYPQQKYCGSNVKREGCSYLYRGNPRGYKTDLSTPRRCAFKDCNKEFMPTGARNIYCGNRKDKTGCTYKLLLLGKKKDRDNHTEGQRAYNTRLKRNSLLRKEYGITIEIYEEMLAKQNNKCAICPRMVWENQNGVFSVDHNHTTGQVRDLLCQQCNTGIGMFFEDINRMSQAIDYIKKHGK